MCPRVEPDFDKVHAQTPIWDKGLYELAIGKVAGRAYDKEEKGKVTTVMYVGLRPKLVGVYDSAGKLHTDIDGTEIADQAVEEIRLYIHSQGAREFSKRIMMAIFGYDKKEEEQYNEFVKTLDLRFDYEEKDGEDGYDVTLGAGWNELAGKRVKAQMKKGTFKNQRTDEFEERQDFDSFFPVGSAPPEKKSKKSAA